MTIFQTLKNSLKNKKKMQKLKTNTKHVYSPYEQKPVDYYDSKEAKKKEERKVKNFSLKKFSSKKTQNLTNN